MTLGRDLLQEISPGANENPLGLIGLSPQILRLGLTPDELYSVCRRLSKALLAEVHEDRVTRTERTERLQAQFSSAVTALRDMPTFESALDRLKTEHAVSQQIESRARSLVREHLDRAQRAEAVALDTQTELRRMSRVVGEERQRISASAAASLEEAKGILARSAAAGAVARSKLQLRARVIRSSEKKLQTQRRRWLSLLNSRKASIARLTKKLARVEFELAWAKREL